MQKLKRYIGLFLACGMLLTSCTGDKTETEVSPAPTVKKTAAPTIAPEPTAKPIEKKVVVYARPMDETDGTAQIIKEYNAQSETIEVKYQELPYDLEQSYIQVQKVIASGGNDFDVFDADIVWAAGLAQKQYVVPLDDYVYNDGIKLNRYFQGTIDAATYQKKLWAMPKSVSAGMMFLREDITTGAPKTWDDLIALSGSLQGVKGTKYGFVMSGKITENIVCSAIEFIYSYGGVVFDESGNIAINNEKSIKGLEKLYEVYNSDFTPDNIAQMSDNNACVSFLNGESVFIRTWPQAWAMGNGSSSAVRGKFAIAPLPAGDAGSVSTLGGSLIMMNKNSANKDEAWDFMKYVSGVEGQTLNAIYGGKVPALKEVMDNKAVVEKNPHFGSANFKNAIVNAVPRAVTPYYKDFSLIMQEELYKFLRTGQPVQKTVQNIEDLTNNIIKPVTLDE